MTIQQQFPGDTPIPPRDELRDPRHGIGGNNPPEPTPFETLSVEANERIDVANQWLIERPLITDHAMADKAAGFESQLRGTWAAMNEARREEKRPLEEQLKAIDARYSPLLRLLDGAKVAIENLRLGWLRREERRLAEEKAKALAEARRQAEEAEAAQRAADEARRKAGADALRAQLAADDAADKAEEAARAAAAAPTKAVIKGDYTPRAVSLRAQWTAVVTDEQAALRHYGRDPAVRKAALDVALKLAQTHAKATKSADAAPPGFKFFDAAREDAKCQTK